MPTPLAGATLRASPEYELVLFDRLPAEQQTLLDGLTSDPDFYGILQPRAPYAGGRGIKSVCRETALLFLTLQTPGPAPAYVGRVFGANGEPEIAELVLDGVLEVEANGVFRSGAAAFEILYGAPSTSGDRPQSGAASDAAPPLHRVARLSLDALRYAQALELDDSTLLSARLYFYNRQPASAHLHRRFPSPDAIAEYLGIAGADADGRATRRLLAREWATAPAAPSPFDGWRAWRRRDPASRASRASRDSAPGAGYKLYVSPTFDATRDAFAATVAVLSDVECHDFKVGKDLHGLLRPDKLVAYFHSERALREAAEQLAARLRGCPAQGVPFTDAITADGLLSWGIDPPAERHVLAWLERESWRLWVTNRLAIALVAARSDGARETRGETRGDVRMEPWRFALERLRLDGVDPTTWTPTAALWGDTTATPTSAPASAAQPSEPAVP